MNRDRGGEVESVVNPRADLLSGWSGVGRSGAKESRF